jgi:hypothetical protein
MLARASVVMRFVLDSFRHPSPNLLHIRPTASELSRFAGSSGLWPPTLAYARYLPNTSDITLTRAPSRWSVRAVSISPLHRDRVHAVILSCSLCRRKYIRPYVNRRRPHKPHCDVSAGQRPGKVKRRDFEGAMDRWIDFDYRRNSDGGLRGWWGRNGRPAS